MEIIPKKYTILALAAILVVALGIMAYSLRPKIIFKKTDAFDSEIQKIEIQSASDDTASIEKDLDDTDLSDLDKELQDIDKEFSQTY